MQRDTFQRLDGAADPGANLLHASPHEVAVGIRDPDYGWLEIKTQSSAGQISASLMAGSSEAHAGLAAQLPGLVQHLAEQNVHVGSVSVQRDWAQNSSGSGAPGQQGQQAPQGQSQGQNPNQNTPGGFASTAPASSVPPLISSPPISSSASGAMAAERRAADSSISIHV